MHPAKFNVSLFLQQKRWRKRRSRLRTAMIRKRARARAEEHRLIRLTSFGKHSVLIDLLAKVHTKAAPPQGGLIELTVPKIFSVLTEPALAISMVAAFAKSMRGMLPRGIKVDMSKVTEQDLGAHVLLDKLVDEIDQEAKANLREIRWSGTYPESQPMARFVRAMGIVKQLGVEHEYPGPSEQAKLKVFQRHCRHYVVAMRPTSADDRSIAVQRFAEHMDSCLKNAKRRLTPLARAKLCNYVGEIIDNAIQHAGMNDWTIQGYLDTSLVTPMCEIVILNFGKSFAETLEELPSDSYTTDQIAGYLDRHAKGGFFNRTWNREALLTLIALQGMVSSKNRSEVDTRGQGTADLIEFFQKVHDECNGHDGSEKARMSIISGGTRIVFDGTYRIQPNENRTRIIAFNAQNDLYRPPDPNYVMSLQGTRLPGTLIAIQFPLSAGNTTGEAKNG